MLYFPSPCPRFYLDTEHEDFTRLSVFLIVAECVGLPALVWALTVLHRHRKRNGRVLFFIILLLLSDLMELLLNPYVATKLITKDCHWDTNKPYRVFFLSWRSRHCGVYLQQMMVLESVLTLRCPCVCSCFLLSSCSITLPITTSVLFFLWEYLIATDILILSLFPLCVVTVTSWKVACSVPLVKKDSCNKTKKRDWTVFIFTTTTVTIYFIFLTLYIFIQSQTLFIMSDCLLSLRVVIDPLLCVLVCRQEQTHTSSDLSTEYTAVQAEHSV